MTATPSLRAVLCDIESERNSQDAKWGPQNHPDGTGLADDPGAAALAKYYCDLAFENGAGTWRLILVEEVREALAESNPMDLRDELVQVAAVATAWIEALDRRGVEEPSR